MVAMKLNDVINEKSNNGNKKDLTKQSDPFIFKIELDLL